MSEETNYFGEVKPISTTFKIVFGLMAVFSVLPLYSAIKGLEGKFLEGSPAWFFWVMIVLIGVNLLSIYGIFKFKKIAVFSLIISIIIQYLWFLTAYNIEFFDVVFVLFLFLGFGLTVLIPRWKYFH